MNFNEWWMTLFPVGIEELREVFVDCWREAQESERESCTNMLKLSNSELQLIAGEMTAQELRTVKAILKERANAIRIGGVTR